jgi:hypothetical protein
MDEKGNIRAKTNLNIIVFLSCLLILALKNNLNGVFYPPFGDHEAFDLFKPYYDQKGFSYIFEYLSGYLLIIPKTVAYILSFLSPRYIPFSYAITSMVFAAITFVVIFIVLKNLFGKWWALCGTLTIAALPLADHQHISNLPHTIWNMLLILIFLYFLPVPEEKKKRLPYCLLVVAMIWSHPLSLLMLPLYFYKLNSDNTNKWVHGLFFGSTVLYYLFGVIHKPIELGKLATLTQVLLDRVVLESVFGIIKSAYIRTSYDLALQYEATILFFLLTFWGLFWKERSHGEKVLFFASNYLIISIVGISILGGNYNDDFLVPWQATRYLVAAKTLFWVLLFFAPFPLIKKNFNLACIHALLIGFILFNNIIGPYKGTYLYLTKTDRGVAVIEFMSKIPQKVKECDGNRPEKEFILKKTRSGHMDYREFRIKGCEDDKENK